VTKAVAASKLTGFGSSDCTFQPMGPNRIRPCADSTAAASSMAQRLAEHLVADARRRPAPAHDVLVEPLPGPDAQGEAAVAEQRRGGRRLGDIAGW
jgi:hypothetical protein